MEYAKGDDKMTPNRKIHLIAFDLDGTTLQHGNVLSERNRRAMENAAAAGVHVVPSTGRIVSFLPACLTEIPGIRYALTSNGAAVWDMETGRRLCANLIDPETALCVTEIAAEYKIYMELYVNGRSYTRRGDPEKAATVFGFPPEKLFFTRKSYNFVDDFSDFIRTEDVHPEKINFMYVPDAVRDAFYARLQALGTLEITYSNVDNFELNAKGCDKGWGLRALCDALRVDIAETMAIGDNGNDFGMLREAGFPVAVDNAIDAVKAMCRAVVADYREDGFAEAVERFVLNQ